MPETFTFSLVPDAERVPIAALEAAIRHISALLRSVDQTVSRNWRVQRTWYVERIWSSSPTIQLSPGEQSTLVSPSAFQSTAQVVYDGIEELVRGNGSAPPASFSSDELEHLRRLRSIFRPGSVARLEAWAGAEPVAQPPEDRIAVAANIAEHVERILGSGYAEYGSIEGELGALRTRGKQPIITIWDVVHEAPVRCTIPREQLDSVKGLLEHRVLVRGLVRYFSDGRPYRLSEFQDIRDLAPDPLRPRATFGSVPNITGGRDTVEYLRMIRES